MSGIRHDLSDFERTWTYAKTGDPKALTQPRRKTYFVTRDTHNELPIEFVCSRNPRYITFQFCRATCNGALDGETELHSNLIQRDGYCDHLVWYTNFMPPDDNRKFEFVGSQRSFDIWFTDAEGKEIKPDNFTAFFKLEY